MKIFIFDSEDTKFWLWSNLSLTEEIHLLTMKKFNLTTKKFIFDYEKFHPLKPLLEGCSNRATSVPRVGTVYWEALYKGSEWVNEINDNHAVIVSVSRV